MQKQLPDHLEGLRSRFVTQRLATALGLSAGAISLAELAQAADAEPSRTLNTLVMPDAYEQVGDDRVLLRLNTGEQLSLISDQFVMLDGGLLLVVDELAQEAISQLPVMGAVRTQLLTEVQPVRSADGSVVEATDAKPLWSGDGDAPRLFEHVDIGRYELAQAHQESQFTQQDLQVSSIESSKSVAAFGGPLCLILISGLFHNEAETVEKHQAATPIIHPYNNFAIRLDGVGANDQSGWPVTSAGDVDGDGKGDILIGASNADPGGKSNAGETYLVFGSHLASNPGSIDLGVLSGPTGVRLEGGNVDDSSGVAVSSAGDVDGDNKDDILIGAFGADPSGKSNAGETYLIFGSFLATQPETIKLNTLGTNGIRLDGINQDDHSGYAVSSAGDVDDDGRDDILIGAFGADPNGKSNAGETYLVFGSYLATKPEIVDLNTLGSNGIRLDGVDVDDNSGYRLSPAGDVDGDEMDDILINAFGADTNGNANAGAGETYLVFGSHLATRPGTVDLNTLGANGIRLDGIDPNDGSGGSISSAGDVDGDGKDDILIGAAYAGPGAEGETYLVFGSYLATKPGTVDLNALGSSGILLNGTNAFGASGGSVSSAGDVDGDGKDDILIGAWGAGQSYLLFGSYLASNPGSVELSNFSGSRGVRLDGIDASDFSGASVSSAGDVDGDGKDDILIGAWLGDVGANTDAGETYLISGHTIDQAADGIGVANAGVIDLALDLGLG